MNKLLALLAIVVVLFGLYLSLGSDYENGGLSIASAQQNITILCENLSISNLNAISDYSGDIKVLGKVVNNSTQTIGGLGLVAEFYDNQGKLVEVEEETPIFQSLEPDASSPFEITTLGVKNATVGSITLTCTTNQG